MNKRVMLIVAVVVLLMGCSGDVVYALAEQAYMEGQIDYMNGDVRVERVAQEGITDYVWVKSPWDDEQYPVHKYRSEY